MTDKNGNRLSNSMADKVAAHIEQFVASVRHIPDLDALLHLADTDRTALAVMDSDVRDFIPMWNHNGTESVKQRVYIYREGRWVYVHVPQSGNHGLIDGVQNTGKPIGAYLTDKDSCIVVHSKGYYRAFPMRLAERWNTLSVWGLKSAVDKDGE